MTLVLKNPALVREAVPVGGRWIKADQSGIAVTNPATGEVIGHVPNLGAAETLEAIEVAQVAQKTWAARTAKDRSNVLRRWFDLMMDNQADLARILTAEQGKPLAEASGEVGYGASFIEWFSEEARRAYGDITPGHAPDKRILTVKQPIGVVAAITPWNFPNAMIARKAAPAFAAGCAMVLKPSELTPFSAIAMAVLAHEAGIPAGLFSVLTGDAATIGQIMTDSKIVRKLTFTGSTGVGAKLYAQCAPTVKKLGLELGGNAPFIVFDDADLDTAVEGALISKFRNNGQTCVCANRLYVQADVYDAFSKKLVEAVEKMKVGDGFEDGVTAGPLIDAAALDKVKFLVADATSKGANIVAGGTDHSLGGTFYPPTVMTDVTREMDLAQEEIFGPVAPLFKFETVEDVIEQANDTIFGLASYFYASDLSNVWKVAEALEYGMVGVNTGLISTEVAPFGGVKQSGQGREGSKYGTEDYLEIKYICMSV